MISITKAFGLHCNTHIVYNDDSSVKLTGDDCTEMSLYGPIVWSYDILWLGGASDPRARGPGLDTSSGHILSFLLPLIRIKKDSCQLLAT